MDLQKILGEELAKQVKEKLGDKKIMVDNENFIPKNRVDEIIKERNKYKSKIEELEKQKPDEQKALDELKAKQSELWQLQKELILEKANLGDFKDFFVADDVNTLEEKITAFKGILGDKFKDASVKDNYKPENRKQIDQYAEASKKGDVEGMIGYKLSKLFR